MVLTIRKGDFLYVIYYIVIITLFSAMLSRGGNWTSALQWVYGVILALAVLIQIYNNFFNMKNVSMQIGIDKGKVVMERYEDYITIYENRHKLPIYWLYVAGVVYITYLFASYGFWVIVGLIILSALLNESSRYRAYKCVKENKTTWGAAAFIIAAQDAFGELMDKPQDDQE